MYIYTKHLLIVFYSLSRLLFFPLLSAFISVTAYAASIKFHAIQDASIDKNQADVNQSDFSSPRDERLLVSSTNFDTLNESMFGFDTNRLSDFSEILGSKGTLRINKVTFNAYRLFGSIHQSGENPINVSLGNTTYWDAGDVTWNTSNGDYGNTLDTVFTDTDTKDGTWLDWDISGADLVNQSDELTTFCLHTEALGGNYGHNDQFERDSAFLDVDYDVEFDDSACTENVNLTTIESIGTGQSDLVNKTLSVTFTGYLKNAQNIKRKVKICSDTVLAFEAQSTSGEAKCFVNDAEVGSSWLAKSGDVIVCSNAPSGSDKDIYNVR